MTKKLNATAELYGTTQVAEILEIEAWRVKNFSEGGRYQLPPSQQVGSGRGSRRLYGWVDIFRIGIAERLVKIGLTAQSVGGAIREIPESYLEPYGAMLRAGGPDGPANLKPKETPILLCVDGAWRTMMAPQAETELRKILKHGKSRSSVCVLNVANTCDSIFRRLEQYWAQ